MQLLLDTEGLILTAYRGAFQVQKDDVKKRISPKKVTSIAITSGCLIHSKAVKLAIEHQVQILFFDSIGKAKAKLWSPYFENIATLRRLQIKFAETPFATEWIINLFELKAEQQIKNLQYLQERNKPLQEQLGMKIGYIRNQTKKFEQYKHTPIEVCRKNIMGIEGSIAAMYWRGVADALPEDYTFERRSRRPALDIFNAALNYLYGMTYTIVEAGLFAAGLDPYLGILHTDEHKKPVLSYDLIEPFRPWIDRLLLEECFKYKIYKTHFTTNQHGLFLNKKGKAFLIPLFNDFMMNLRLFQDIRVSNKNHIYQLAGQLAKRIKTHHINTTEDVPY